MGREVGKWRRAPRAVLTVIVSVVAATGCGDGITSVDEPDETVLQGVVIRFGQEVLLADVPLAIGGRRTTSNDRGQYRFEAVPVGEHELTASLEGYLPFEERVRIDEGSNTFNVVMLPIQLSIRSPQSR